MILRIFEYALRVGNRQTFLAFYCLKDVKY